MSAPTTSSTVEPCAAERCGAARAGAVLFRNRGWLPVFFLAVPLLWPLSHQVGHHPLGARMSAVNWAIGLLLVAIGEGIRLAGVAAAGTTTRRRSRAVQRLVTYGAFAWSRNPLYNGNFLIWIGFAVVSGVLWFLPVAAAIFALEYSLIVRFEEGVLESTFGDEYLAYKRRTPRWIPRPPAAADRGPETYDWAQAWRSELSTFLQYAALVVAFVLKQWYF
ncbi:MAG: methyltransferase family protein [Gemmatimonadaceae bacterium]